MSNAEFLEIKVETTAVPGPRKAGVLLPPDFDASHPPLPVLFLLHGGMGYAGRASMRMTLFEKGLECEKHDVNLFKSAGVDDRRGRMIGDDTQGNQSPVGHWNSKEYPQYSHNF